MKPFRQGLIALFSISWLLLSVHAYSQESSLHVDGAHFRLFYRSMANPIPLNRIHTWLIHLETKDGLPVSNASFAIYGGMPAHRHGLPTRPRIRDFGDGHYWLEGVKFSMKGKWELWFDISTKDKTDKIKIELSL